MKNTISAGLLVLAMIFGCTAPQNSIQTRPLAAGDTSRMEGYVYALPLTVFRIDVELVKTRTIRGPYYRFADKYLGIRDVPSQNLTRWHIDRVQLHALQEADPDQLYLVRQIAGETDLSSWVKLSEAGLIVDFRAEALSESHSMEERISGEGPVYTDLSIMPNIVESEDNLYKTILTDSSFIQVPVTTQQLIVRTIDEKAREAADVILEIRQNRIDALSGKNNAPLTAAGIRRMDSLEQEYLSLFIGKELSERHHHSYHVTPPGMEDFENFEVLEFSEQRGILREQGRDSKVLSLSCRKLGKTDLLDQSGTRAGRLNNALYYRIPDQALVEVSLGEETLISKRIPVYQFGSILSLPVPQTRRKQKIF